MSDALEQERLTQNMQLPGTSAAADATAGASDDFPPLMEVTSSLPLPSTDTSPKRTADKTTGVPEAATLPPAAKRACAPGNTQQPASLVEIGSSPPPAKTCATTSTPRNSLPQAQPSSRYKVAIKPRQHFNILNLSTKTLQTLLDSCLGTSGFTGYAYHRPTNTVSVWVPTLDAVAKLCSLQHIALTADTILQVQAYLVSGTDIRRYVVAGVDPGENPDYIRDNIKCDTHQVLLVRYMGSGRTCLVTLRGPLDPPNRLFYNGCVLRPRPYKAGVVHCYRCFRQGHMSKSCPFPAPDAREDATASPQEPKFKCGLCRSDDHEITDKGCPTKSKATRAKRRAWRARSQPNPTSTFNRFDCLVEEDEDAMEEEAAEPPSQPTYRDVVRRSRHRRQPVSEVPSSPMEDELVALDQKLAMLHGEITKLTKRKSQLTRRQQRLPQSSEDSTSPPRLFSKHHQSAPPTNSIPSPPASTALTHQELLQFVVHQLQSLVSVLAAQLR